MSYVGYIPAVKHRLSVLPHAPALLEVGIDRGTTLVPLVAFLARKRPIFDVVAVDIAVQEQVGLVLQNLDLMGNQRVTCVAGNSLDVLPAMAQQGMRFDVVLLDGDHNYHTVTRELALLEDLVRGDDPMVIIDDYSGRWAERDLWYAERPGYEACAAATRRIDTDKHGVKPAVDEWLAAHPAWHASQPLVGEPVVLTRHEHKT